MRAPKFSWVSPYITVSDINKSIDFYTKTFGFTLKEKMEGHAELMYKDQVLMLGNEGKTPNTLGVDSPMNLYLYIENIDDFHKKALQHGAKEITAPEDTHWGDRMSRLKCPDGYVWAFATHLGVPCQAK